MKNLFKFVVNVNKMHFSSICRFTLFFLSICHSSLASWSPIPPNFPYPPGPPIGWPLRMGPPPGPAPPNFFRPAPLPFPLSDFSGFAPIGFEYPSQEELLQMEREKKQRKERLKAEKSKSIGKRVEDQRYATTTTESNDQRTSTESYSTATNSFEDKTRFDDSKSGMKLTEYDKMREDRIKSFYRPGDLKDKSESKHEESKKPLDVRRKQTVSPNGQVTFITEMLYDIEGGNPFKPTTSPPSASSPFLPPTTDGMYNPTDDPRLTTQTAHPYTTYLPGTIPRPGESNDDRWHLMPTPPTPFRSSSNKQQQYAERGDLRTSSHRVTGSHLHQGHQNHHHSHGHKGSSTNPRGSTSRRDGSNNSIVTETHGLGAAAIAGIVIGSLVSVALLAGEPKDSSRKSLFFSLL